jgi:hypothetical protein
MLGLEATSTIASASAASFFWQRTNGLRKSVERAARRARDR